MNISGSINKGLTFLKEVRLEIRKINWPTRQETIKYTFIVIGVCFVVAAFLGSLDFLFAYVLQLMLFK